MLIKRECYFAFSKNDELESVLFCMVLNDELVTYKPYGRISTNEILRWFPFHMDDALMDHHDTNKVI